MQWFLKEPIQWPTDLVGREGPRPHPYCFSPALDARLCPTAEILGPHNMDLRMLLSSSPDVPEQDRVIDWLHTKFPALQEPALEEVAINHDDREYYLSKREVTGAL